MNRYPLLAFISFLILFFASCENRYRKNVGANPAKSTTSQEASLSKQKVDVAKDAYQVSADEYDEFFTSRYGLLYQKFSDTPFTGQIITAENGPEGKFVVADESWRNGKKDGPSTRWFSNGVKMYERNYTDGKWNGTVTRWWPNGQKMYVRAYSEGVRHGEEATWRSDGTPIKKASSVSNVKETPAAVENSADTNEFQPEVFPAPEAVTENIDFTPSPAELPEIEPVVESIPEPSFSNPLPPSPEVPEVPVLPVEILPVAETAVDMPEPALPGLPGIDDSLPEIPTTEETAPSFPTATTDQTPSPDLPLLPDLSTDLPNDSSEDAVLPTLPGLPVESSDELPPMPLGDDSLPGLPPLPGIGNDDSSGELPPLPPLP